LTPPKRFTCKLCGAVLPAWLPVPQEPNGAMLLHHLGRQHPDQIKGYLDRIHTTDDIASVAAEAFELIYEQETP
jgi:hypothetical protein